MCDSRFWLLRGLGVEAPATARAEFHFRGAHVHAYAHALSLTVVPSNSAFSLECFGVSFKAALAEFE